MYEYYILILHDRPGLGISYTGVCYKLDHRLDSSESILKLMELLKDDGYKNAVVMFYKELNKGSN